MRIALILALLFSGLAFAQFGATPGEKMLNCQINCCSLNGGTWDTSEQYCDIDYDSEEYYDYSDCVEECIEGVAVEEGWETGTGDAGCCGSAFILLALLGFVSIRR